MEALIQQLKGIVGDGAWQTDPDELEPNLTEWRNVVHGRTPIMVSPQTTEQVAEIVRACSAAGVGLVPQGGNTGMCAGAVPDESGEQILVNLSRLNRIRSVDADDFSMVVEAGCVLADVHSAAREANRYFPLSMGGEGSCQIGGNLSTNAGGINVIRYGTARDLVLGVEVVLADGTVWDGLKTLRKDTAGYDLKQLFIGSEGTLGIVTAAALRLFPDPGETVTALAAVSDASSAVTLLGTLRHTLQDQIQAFELIGSRAIEYVERHIPNVHLPFASPWYVLLDAAGDDAAESLQRGLMDAIEDGIVADVAIAKNDSEAEGLWRIRHSISEAERKEGPGVKHDISVPIASMQAFLVEGERRLAEQVPEAEPVIFGHVGDGNLHYNAHLPSGLQADREQALRTRISEVVYELVRELGGSISAEHGIGVLKRDWLAANKDDVELGLMRRLKEALDPKNTLNPGKVI
ncbi:MAG: FAD-binding oxidoreductase [Woeseiaceae bacterium]|nr:FAD-binding oxidoreductase [Woeseiaceae bacterium]